MLVALLPLAGCVLVWLLLRSPAPMFVIHRNIEFARVGDRALLLDLYLPSDRDQPPAVILWIHGGGWRYGDRTHCPLRFLASEGYAIASIDYRLSTEAFFPAQIHDCKASVRWLRAQADKYRIDASSIVAAGESAGAHLALLLGTTSGVASMDGTVGTHTNEATQVAAVIDFFGSSNLVAYEGAAVGDSDEVIAQLLGGPLADRLEQAQQASPIFWLTALAAPTLVLHAESDPVVPIAQSRAFVDLCREKKVSTKEYWLTGVAAEKAHHTGPFLDEQGKGLIRAFLKEYVLDR